MHIHGKWLSFLKRSGAICLAGICFTPFLGCGLTMRGVSMSTEVAPIQGEDLHGSCVYDLVMFNPTVPQTGVLVIYERGDSESLFDDFEMEQMASANRLAMVFARQCNAESYGDIQDDGTKGPGRTLFAALTQFAQKSGHAELGNSNVILYGFSAGAVLAATTTQAMPERVIGTIEYAMGSAFLDVTTLNIPAKALQVPTLIIANAKDESAGTQRNLDYFEKGRSAGGIWGYAVQNDTGHCCNLSTRDLIIPWIESVLRQRSGAVASNGPAPLAQSAGTVGSFVCSPDGTVDAQGDVDCKFSYAALVTPSAGHQTAWLPDVQTADAWVRWVSKGSTN